MIPKSKQKLAQEQQRIKMKNKPNANQQVETQVQQ